MSNQVPIDADPLAIKPIIEALIFASDEPISPRALIKLLAGENARPSDRIPPLLKMIEEVAPTADEDSDQQLDADEPDEEDAPVTEPDVNVPEVEEPPATNPSIDAPPDDEPPIEEPVIDEPAIEEPPGESPTIDEPEMPEQPDTGDVTGQVVDHMRQGGISLALDAQESGDDGNGVADLVEAMEGTNRRAAKRGVANDSDALDQRYIRRIVDLLNIEYDEGNRAFRIVEVAGGFQFATMREYGEYVALLSKEKSRRRLSAAALETLAIIAYRQPVSKPEIEAIRGVNCDQVLLNLMEKNLVVITGRSEAIGRPLLYGTTEDFLRSFGLNNLSDLPKLREIEELMETDAFSAESTQVVMIDQETDVEEIEARVGAVGHQSTDEEDDGEESAVNDQNAGDEAMTSEVDAADAEDNQQDLSEHEENPATEEISYDGNNQR